jgi:DNA-binding response OmpR family regulator
MSTAFPEPQPRKTSSPMTSPPDRPSGASVLVVDDDDAMRGLCALVLARACYQPVTAVDGEQAWQLFSTQPFDLLVTDNSMPGLSGLDLIDMVRQSGSRIPIIVASGSAKQCDLEAGNWPGYVRALPKPFHMTDLLREITTALRSARPASQDD